MAKFFISYSRKAKDTANEIRRHISLLDSKHRVFVDTADIKTGANWKNTLTTQINSCDFFILILSVNAIKSKYIAQEVGLIRKQEHKSGLRKLFVYQIDDVDIPPYIGSFQVLKNSGNFAVDFYRLMDGVFSGASFFSVQQKLSLKDDWLYGGEVWIEAEPEYMSLIKYVEYRFDYSFDRDDCGQPALQILNATQLRIRKKFKVNFEVAQHVTLFTMLYLKNTEEISIITPIILKK